MRRIIMYRLQTMRFRRQFHYLPVISVTVSFRTKQLMWIDEACAKVSLSGFKTPEHIYELEKVLGNYEAKMEEAILAGDLVEASRDPGRKKMLRKKIMQTKKRFQKNRRAENHL